MSNIQGNAPELSLGNLTGYLLTLLNTRLDSFKLVDTKLLRCNLPNFWNLELKLIYERNNSYVNIKLLNSVSSDSPHYYNIITTDSNLFVEIEKLVEELERQQYREAETKLLNRLVEITS